MIDRHNETPMMPRGRCCTRGKQFWSPRNRKQAHLRGEIFHLQPPTLNPRRENHPCRKFQITLSSLAELMTNRYTEWDGAEQTNNRRGSKYTFIHQLRVVSRVLYSKQVERVLDSHVDVSLLEARTGVCLRRCVTLKTWIYPRISEEGEGQTWVSDIIWIESDSKTAVSISRVKLVRRRPTHSPVIQWNDSMFLSITENDFLASPPAIDDPKSLISRARPDESSCPRAERNRWLAETFLQATDRKHQDSALNDCLLVCVCVCVCVCVFWKADISAARKENTFYSHKQQSLNRCTENNFIFSTVGQSLGQSTGMNCKTHFRRLSLTINMMG